MAHKKSDSMPMEFLQKTTQFHDSTEPDPMHIQWHFKGI